MIGVRAGRLRHRLVFQRKTETRNAHGGIIDSWSNTTTRWGAIEAKKGDEKLIADRTDVRQKYEIFTRYISDLKETDRIINNGDIYHITSIDNKDRRDWQLKITAIIVDQTNELKTEDGQSILLETDSKLLLEDN